MFRDLLVHVDGGEAGRRRVQFAVNLAVRMGARLSGLHVAPPTEVPPRYRPSRIAEVADEVSAQLALDARVAATIFSEEASRHMADACWYGAAGDVVEGISDKARYADLVILGQYEWQGSPESHPLPIAHSVVLRCGRPQSWSCPPSCSSARSIELPSHGMVAAKRSEHSTTPCH